MRAYKLLILSFLCLCGCMQHNGYIGDWFGTWHLETITVDGTEDTNYKSNFFFQFQSDKIRLCSVDPTYPEMWNECFGTWEASDKVLELNLTYTGVGPYWTPWEGTYLSHDNINVLQIEKFTSSRLILKHQFDDKTVVYNLKKQ